MPEQTALPEPMVEDQLDAIAASYPLNDNRRWETEDAIEAFENVRTLYAEVERLRDVQATLVDGGTYTASQLNRIAGIIRHADLMHHVVELEPGEEPPTLDSVIQAITQVLVEDEPVKNACTIVWRELIGGMLLRSEQALREMAERDRDEARAELERVGRMTPAELLTWRAER